MSDNWGGEERRRSMDLTIQEMRGDLKTLLYRQVEIQKQVEKTNGRVSVLENWRSFSVGAISIILVLIVPVVLYVIQKWIG